MVRSKTALKMKCICDSEKPFQKCCEPLLTGQKKAKTPVQLMRSRYSAYAKGGFGDYLLATWLPDTRAGLNAAELSLRSIDWVRLEVINKAQKGINAVVEFKAYFLDENGGERVHHEHSLFERMHGEWFYVGEQ